MKLVESAAVSLFAALLFVTSALAKESSEVNCNLSKITIGGSKILKSWTLSAVNEEQGSEDYIAAEGLHVQMSGNLRGFSIFEIRKDGYASQASYARQPDSIFDLDLSFVAPALTVYNLQCRGN
ncbi:MAG: hypothetical protein EOP11_01920 [Proteobacteria bacterium]|nr:MAG: hypothetical protein EOP11_01920 [Pseudomonadota bacterium]